MNILFLAVLSIALSVAAQFSLKLGMSGGEVQSAMADPLGFRAVLTIFTNVFVILGFGLYVVGAGVWLGVLSAWDVSKAYPLVGLGFVFTLCIGWLIGEQVTLVRALGVGFICSGVFLVGRS